MPKIFLAPYHSNLHKERRIKGNGRSGVLDSYVAAIKKQNAWPLDSGDDPSFFSSEYFDGPLTWGVCRGDVRNSITAGSVVIFFAYTQLGELTTYRLSAIATVKQKVKQSAIFADPELKIFRGYLNLLISPDDEHNQFFWNEPCYPDGQHYDWMWRLANRSEFRSSDFRENAVVNEISVGQLVNGKRYSFGSNYVIFSTDETETYVLEKPPQIARSFGSNIERWEKDSLSQAVLSRTLSLARQHSQTERGLRIPGGPRPHSPAVRWPMDDSNLKTWRAELIALLRSHG